MSKKKTSLQVLFFTILLPLFLSSLLLNAEKAHPPLVPEGETFENLQVLLENTSRKSPVWAVTFSPDGKILASCHDDETVRLWEVFTGKLIRIMQGHTGFVTSICFSPDCNILASGGDDATIRLWSMPSGKHIFTLKGHTDRVTSMCFSSKGNILASGSYDGTVRLWNISSRKSIYKLKCPKEHYIPRTVSFSPDGMTLAYISEDYTIKLWDINTKKIIRTFDGQDHVDTFCYTPDGKTIASWSSDGIINMRDVDTGKITKSIKVPGPFIFFCFSPDGKSIASTNSGCGVVRIRRGLIDNNVRLMDISIGKNILTLQEHTDSACSVCLSPDGKAIASGSLDGTIRLWNTTTGKNIRTFKSYTHRINSVNICPSGKTLAFFSGDTTIRLWNLDTGEPIRNLEVEGQDRHFRLFSLCLSSGDILAAGASDGTVHLWKVPSLEPISTLEVHTRAGYKKWVTSLRFSNDGTILASGYSDGTIRLWNACNDEILNTFKGHDIAVSSLSFNGNGKILASGSWDKTIRLWNVSTGKHIRTLKGHRQPVASVSFSRDGDKLVSGSWDKTIRLWNVSTGKLIGTMQGHTNIVTSVSLRPDGNVLASGSYDRTIRLWNLSTGKTLHILQDHTGWVNDVSFSSTGKILASGSADGTIRVYIYNKNDNNMKTHQVFIAGHSGNWLSFKPDEKRFWRYDDGTLLVKKDKSNTLSAVRPPQPDKEGKLEVKKFLQKLQTFDGKSTDFNLKLKNIGKGRIYWVKISQGINKITETSLVFHPPPPWAVLNPGEEVEMPCTVSAFSQYTNPTNRESTLYLKITTAYGDPISMEIPVDIHVPTLQLLQSKLQKQETTVLIATLQNIGGQDISNETEFIARLGNNELNKVSQKTVNQMEPFELSFTIPDTLEIDENSRLNLTARKLEHPVHVWEFNDVPIIFPTPAWYWYVLFGVLFLGSIIGIYYLRLYTHPLTLKLSKTPGELLHLAPQEIPTALNLLRRTRRFDTVLSSISVSKSLLEQAIEFHSDWDPEKRCHYLAERLDGRYESMLENGIHLFKFHLSRDFILNMEQSQCLVAFTNNEIPAHEILSRIKKVEGANYLVCVFISSNEEQQAKLRKSSLNLNNLFVTPESKELTHLLLSPNPLDVFAGLIASQVKVTRISPYQIKTGVNKESIFFGREQLLAHIMQREPANYLLVGARQIGKSSLLKAIERRYMDHQSIECHYLVLEGNEITGHLARAMKLPVNIPLPGLLERMSQGEEGKRRLFLIDEADKFIAGESQTGCATLKHFRSLSEKGKCYFIFAGFWDLYHAAVFDYQSPIKNFGEILSVEALEADACRQLATKPMAMLNIHYESNDLVENLIHETGQRANLIAIICNEMLKKLDMTERLIRKQQLEEAFDSKAVISTLSGWEMISLDETANCLDRIIVYATIDKETFTQAELMRFLESKGVSYEAEHVKQSLARLELAFILKRDKQHYSYRVPLFEKMVRQQDPGDLLGRELKAVH